MKHLVLTAILLAGCVGPVGPDRRGIEEGIENVRTDPWENHRGEYNLISLEASNENLTTNMPGSVGTISWDVLNRTVSTDTVIPSDAVTLGALHVTKTTYVVWSNASMTRFQVGEQSLILVHFPFRVHADLLPSSWNKTITLPNGSRAEGTSLSTELRGENQTIAVDFRRGDEAWALRVTLVGTWNRTEINPR